MRPLCVLGLPVLFFFLLCTISGLLGVAAAAFTIEQEYLKHDLPRLALIEQPFASVRSAYRSFLVSACAPPNSTTLLLGVTHPFRCPCVVSYAADVPRSSSTPHDAIDFLFLPASSVTQQGRHSLEHDHHDGAFDLPSVRFDRYLNVSKRLAKFSSQDAQFVSVVGSRTQFQRHPFNVHLSGSFIVAVRTRLPKAACHIRVSLILHSKRPVCPTVLPPQLPSTSPSPSPSPSHSVPPTSLPSPNISSSSSTISSTVNSDYIITYHFNSNIYNSSTPLPSPSLLAKTPPQPRIVGGHQPHQSFRTHLAAFSSGTHFVCSGSVLSSRWVLTAAHCDIRQSMRVIIGAARLPEGAERNVEAVLRHPEFSPSTDSPFDVAVVRLSADVPVDTRFVLVNINQSAPVPQSYVRVAGYGQTSETASFDAQLRQVDVPIVSMSDCQARYASANPDLAARLSEDSQLCAGIDAGGCDACHGDSGGPLVYLDANQNLVQAGIVSFGIGCARAYLPGVYTRVAFFEPWLRQVGVTYTRSDGVKISPSYAFATPRAPFSIAGLSTLYSILLLCAAVIVATIVAGIIAFVVIRHSRGVIASDDAAPPTPTRCRSTVREHQRLRSLDADRTRAWVELNTGSSSPAMCNDMAPRVTTP